MKTRNNSNIEKLTEVSYHNTIVEMPMTMAI